MEKGGAVSPPIEDLGMIRTEAQLSVSRFAELIGVPRRTYHYRLARHRAGDPEGVWPAPVVDRIEPTVAKYAEAWLAWGHRKVWALARADGHDVGSQASVARAMFGFQWGVVSLRPGEDTSRGSVCWWLRFDQALEYRCDLGDVWLVRSDGHDESVDAVVASRCDAAAVELEKGGCCEPAESLVAVNERVVVDDGIQKRRSFRPDVGVGIGTERSRLRP